MVLSCLCRENPTKSIPGYFEFGFFGEVSVDVLFCFLNCLTFLSNCIQDILLNLETVLGNPVHLLPTSSAQVILTHKKQSSTVKKSSKINLNGFPRAKSKLLEQKDDCESDIFCIISAIRQIYSTSAFFAQAPPWHTKCSTSTVSSYIQIFVVFR